MAPRRWTLEAVNQRLKQANVPVRVRQHGGTLSLRATLPPKPGKAGPAKQQEISLRIYANPAGLQRAEAEALKLGSLLSLDKFDWNLYLKPGGQTQRTCAEWVEDYKVDFFETHGKTPSTEHRWRHDIYSFILKRLPAGEPLTEQAILEVATRPKANTRSRQVTCQRLQHFSKFVGMDVNLSDLSGNYSPAKQEVMDIPSDEEIATWAEKIKNPHWAYVYRLIATYGLRNHEVFFTKVDLEPPYLAHVTEGKTGDRTVSPLYPEWVERWKLWEENLPPCTGKTHRDFGQRVVGAFNKRREGLPFPVYALRHAYAIRASVTFQIPLVAAASMMGHSPTVHLNRYNRWIKQAQTLEAYQRAIASENRPAAP